MSSKAPKSVSKIVNRKARFNFEVLESVEAGIALTGSEVKSLRAGQASLDEAHGRIRAGEVFLVGCNIAPYPMAGYAQHTPLRERKLLLHRSQIRKWEAKVTQRGFTLVPLSIYFADSGRAKVDLALVRGKTHGDKRSDIRERDTKREMQRAMRRH